MNPTLQQLNNGAQIIYGSRVSLKEAMAVANEELARPSIDEVYIKNIASSRGPIGEEDIRHYHAKLYNERIIELLAKCGRMLASATVDLEGINQHIKELSAIVHATERYRDFNNQSTPWTTAAWIQVIILICVSILLLAVGINTVAQVLHASGTPGFEQAWRCYLFSFLPVGIAFGLKGLRHFIQDPKQVVTYSVAIWLVGLALAFLWVLLFAQRFPGLTQSVADIVSSISVSGNESKSHSGDTLFIFVSMLGETFLAAGCWLTAEAIVHRHSPPVRQNNPAYEKAHSDLDHFLNRRCEQQTIIGKINGKMQAIEEARKRFVEEAVGSFRAAVNSYQQAQNILQNFKP
jgi:hypothetical protein